MATFSSGARTSRAKCQYLTSVFAAFGDVNYLPGREFNSHPAVTRTPRAGQLPHARARQGQLCAEIGCSMSLHPKPRDPTAFRTADPLELSARVIASGTQLTNRPTG